MLLGNIDHQILQVNQLFSEQKNEEVLITSPLPEKWSAKQCVEHLNKTLALYLPRIRASLELTENTAEDSYKSGFIGHRFISSMSPSDDTLRVVKGMKTFKSLKPGVSGKSSIDVVMTFATQMKELKTLVLSSQYKDFSKLKVTSAIGPIIRFRLGDAYSFVLAHNQRHILQAVRAVALCNKH